MKELVIKVSVILIMLFYKSVICQTTLKMPLQEGVFSQHTDSVCFLWENDEINSFLDISQDLNFSTFQTFFVSQLTTKIDVSIFDSQNYWRVRTNIDTSVIRSFKVIDLETIGILPYHINSQNNVTLIGNQVVSWQNLPNFNFNATQNNLINAPSYEFNKINGLNMVKFGGNTGTSFTRLELNPAFSIPDTNFTVIMLFKQITVKSGNVYMFGSSLPKAGVYPGSTGSGGRVIGFRDDINNRKVIAQPNLNWKLFTITHSNFYENNNQFPTVSGPSSINFLHFSTIGLRPDILTTNFHGYIGDILIYNEILPDSSRLLVENYLKTKYTPFPNLGSDTIVCNNEYKIGFRTDHGYSDITWSNGQTNVDSITATTSGTYWVTVKSFGLELTDTIILDLRDKPQLNFQNDTISCVENNLFLTFSNLGPFQYTWSNGSNADTLQNLQSGTYYISQNDTANGCIINSDEVNVLIDSFSLQSSLGPDRNFCLGSNLELQTTTINNEPYSYQWSTTDTSSFIVLDTPSDTLINTTVTDAFGCIVKDTLLASVLNLASPTVDFISDTVCFGSTTHFNSLSSPSGSDNIINYEWIFPNSSQLNSFDTTSYSHSLDQTFNVNLTVYTDSNCQNSITKPVYIHRLPVVLFNQEIVCAENSSSFSESSYAFFPDNVNTYSWYVNNLFETNTEDPELIFDTEGFNVLKLVIESDFGCIAELQESIEVFPALNADFSTTNSCIGDSVLFTDETESFSVVDWKWTFGSSLTSSLEKPKMLFNTIGNITVSLEIENAIGCKSTISKNVFISPQPQASFSFDKACENDVSLFYDNSVIVNDSIISFDWEIDTFNYNGDSVEHFFSDLSVYNVSLNIETENGCTDDTSSLVTVNENPSPSFEFTPNYGTAPLEVQFSNLTPGTNQYTWNFGDTVGLSSDEEPLYTYLQNGIYNITLTAINEHNCDADISQQIAVIPSELDIELKNLEFNIVENTDNTFSISPKLEIRNVGTRLIQDAELVLSLNAENKLVQQWENQLGIGEAMAYSFDSYFLVSDLELSKYICVEAINVNDNTEENLTNNKVCSLVEGLIQFSNPYPNPADNNVFIDIITADKGKCSLQVFDIRGCSIIPANDIQLVKGYNKLQIETSLYQSGKYILMIKYLDENYSKQFLIK